MKLFVRGRKSTFNLLRENVSKVDTTAWFHCASLGEYEQAVPIITAFKKANPAHKIIISFFSPSGFEVKKNNSLADVTVYLPLDTPSQVSNFLKLAQPSISFFVKYEIWPNYLKQLNQLNIPVYLVSGLFRKQQIYFKWYGRFMRNSLQTIRHFFVQNEISKELLQSIHIENVTISGDTRFDRVSQQIEIDNTISCMEEFIFEEVCIVCGSTWPEDETVLLPFINSAPNNVKFIIAPHVIQKSKTASLINKISKKVVLFSEKEGKQLSDYDVFIIDTVGLLSKIYSYADIAYVGGGMGTSGLHNILEPATFGVPVVIGHNYQNFPEAGRLRSLAGLFAVKDEEECFEILSRLVNDKKLREKSGMIAGYFINSNTGATSIVMSYLKNQTVTA